MEQLTYILSSYVGEAHCTPLHNLQVSVIPPAYSDKGVVGTYPYNPSLSGYNSSR